MLARTCDSMRMNSTLEADVKKAAFHERAVRLTLPRKRRSFCFSREDRRTADDPEVKRGMWAKLINQRQGPSQSQEGP